MNLILNKRLDKSKLGCVISLCFPTFAMAGTSGYGVEVLIGNLFFYIIGLIVIFIIGGVSKDKKTKIFWTLVFVVYIIFPFIYI